MYYIIYTHMYLYIYTYVSYMHTCMIYIYIYAYITYLVNKRPVTCNARRHLRPTQTRITDSEYLVMFGHEQIH